MEQKIKAAEQWYDKNSGQYEQFSKEIEDIITKILNKKGVPYQSVSHRVKEKDSYLNKCRKEKYSNPVKEITDLSGIRVIAYTNKDVQRICDILKNEFLIDKKNSVNKSQNLETDKVGYRSFHFILQLNENRLSLAEYSGYKGLKCEVQVRTLLQHAWAEIEHDKNYKFAGVLPDDIKRRFHLVAGVLEMMDSEFDRLSIEIDEYSKNMKKAVSEGNFDLSIDSKSLEQYGLTRFKGRINIEPCNNGVAVSEEVVTELKSFGYQTVQDIENDISKHIDTICEKSSMTLIGLYRELMFLEDYEKYFKEAYCGDWQWINESYVNFLKAKGAINIEKYLKEYRINTEKGM